MGKKTVQVDVLAYKEYQIPVHLVIEWRSYTRYALTKKGLIIRVPTVLSQDAKAQEVLNAKHWMTRQLIAKPQLGAAFVQKSYADGTDLVVGPYTYRLVVKETEGQSFSAQMTKDLKNIHLRIPRIASADIRQKYIPQLLSKVIGNARLPEIISRVAHYNLNYFHQPIANIRLRHNHSNWGSCSTKGNINLSTRLLFAPEDVLDYVIVHELAHRIEMNHSERFYDLVRQVMPDFRDKEKWLTIHGPKCHF